MLNGTRVEENVLMAGVPAKPVKTLGDKERKMIERNALAYLKLIEHYKSS